jgi:hypothetical protein
MDLLPSQSVLFSFVATFLRHTRHDGTETPMIQAPMFRLIVPLFFQLLCTAQPCPDSQCSVDLDTDCWSPGLPIVNIIGVCVGPKLTLLMISGSDEFIFRDLNRCNISDIIKFMDPVLRHSTVPGLNILMSNWLAAPSLCIVIDFVAFQIFAACPAQSSLIQFGCPTTKSTTLNSFDKCS